MAHGNRHRHGGHGRQGRQAYFKLSTKDSKQAHLFSINYEKTSGLLEKLKKKLTDYKVDFAKVFWVDQDKDQIFLQTAEDLREAIKFSRFVVKLYVDGAVEKKLKNELKADENEDDDGSSSSSFSKVSGKEESGSDSSSSSESEDEGKSAKKQEKRGRSEDAEEDLHLDRVLLEDVADDLLLKTLDVTDLEDVDTDLALHHQEAVDILTHHRRQDAEDTDTVMDVAHLEKEDPDPLEAMAKDLHQKSSQRNKEL
ncbi:unnamed protein product [Caenorhabditis sp. 36 PRJEB53466]|nr:unnamed protein product [Caenorhabditis sp. 36 PRJEB53466]